MHESTIIADRDLDSRLRMLSEALRTAEERATAGQLALELMHEIRNPLEAVGNLTYLALTEADNPEAVRSYLRRMEEQLATLNQIASQTLGFARTSLAPQAVRLSTLAEAALRIHQRAMQAKKIRVVKDLPEELQAEVYTTEMLQVLSNLIVNALDALPPNGTLCLRLRKRRGEIHFVVADNGHGIPIENRHHVFEPFFTTKKLAGTGLGLALSRELSSTTEARFPCAAVSAPAKAAPPLRFPCLFDCCGFGAISPVRRRGNLVALATIMAKLVAKATTILRPLGRPFRHRNSPAAQVGMPGNSLNSLPHESVLQVRFPPCRT